MHTLTGYVVVFFGAGLGGTLRHAVNRVAMASSSTFPWGTFAVNATGGLAMGLLAGWFTFRGESSDQTLRLFLTTGVLGGYTTFSAFSLDAALLWQRGEATEAVAFVLGSVALSIIGVFGGLAIMRTLLP